MSIQTKETPDVLANLLKAKGGRNDNLVKPPAAVIVEGQNKQVPDTSDEEPIEVTPATPSNQNPEPADTNDATYEKRYKDLKLHYDTEIYRERSENKQLKTQLKEATAPKIEIPKTPEELEAFKQKSPESYDMMLSVALTAQAQKDKELQDRLDKVEKAERKIAEKESFQRLLDFHPDAQEIKASLQFAEWFHKQTDDIKDILVNSTNIESVAKVITLYKVEEGIKTPRQKKKEEAKQREEAAMGVGVKGQVQAGPDGKKVWTGSEITRINAPGNYREFTKYSKEIDEARREGRVDWNK